jgi:WhiB family redox-sensing transcriptional regulator
MAKRICGECPVIRECLQFAMENKCAGIYGGMTEKERKAYAQRH